MVAMTRRWVVGCGCGVLGGAKPQAPDWDGTFNRRACKIGCVKMHENLVGGVLVASVALSGVAGSLFADPPATQAATQAVGANGWDGALFNYRRGPRVVEETTPTRDQVDWHG
jgi:hypothetical protein